MRSNSTPLARLSDLVWPNAALGVHKYGHRWKDSDDAHVTPFDGEQLWHCTVIHGSAEKTYTVRPIHIETVPIWIERAGFRVELFVWTSEPATPSPNAYWADSEDCIAPSSPQSPEIPSGDEPVTEVVYFVQGQDGGPIKIGYAKNVHSRMKSLQGGSPWPLRLLCTLDGGSSLEKQLHHRFARLRMHGEWFRADESLLAFIQAHR